MAYRTTLVLSDEARAAARELARHHGCSTSAAIRRAVIDQRDALIGLSADARRDRKKALRRLVRLFAGVDAAAEVDRIKREDGGF